MIVVVANPAAAAGRVGRQRARIETRLRAAGVDDVRWTEAPGDARRLAAEAAARGAARVGSLGGDGTHHEVAAGLLDAGGGAAMGVLPFGTGGDFARMTVAGHDAGAALAALCDAPARRIDVGRVTWQQGGQTRTDIVLNIVSVGLGGLVDRNVERLPKRLGGRLTFFVATVQAAWSWRPATVRVHVDGRDLGAHCVDNVFACNARFGGGGMRWAPDAVLDDGRLDVLIAQHRSFARQVAAAPTLYRGDVATLAGFERHVAATVDVEAVDGPLWIDLDGEPVGTGGVRVEAVPEALSVVGLRPDAVGRRG